MASPGYPTGHSPYPVGQPGAAYQVPPYGYPVAGGYPPADPPAPAPGFLPYPTPSPASAPPPPAAATGATGAYYTGPVINTPPTVSHRGQQDDDHIVHAPLMGPTFCPPGLEYLMQIDQVLIHQKVEVIEALVKFETQNKYVIKNSLGQKIYRAKEKSDCCTRNCCGSLRYFHMKLLDNSDREVIHLVRPLKCVSCWFPCCLQELEVQSPPGTTIGYVTQTWHPFLPKFSIQNVERTTVLMIVGPCFACNCCGDVAFEVKPPNESRSIGRISKQWSGVLKEVLTDADNFGVQFPMNLDVKMKATLLGACFLIDYIFFERGKGSHQKQGVWE
ncbi:phospholipid scramblase 2-like [Leucoraja erinacea]|uniref:phospholipid scramblase 2-like n=1 Tax=Leucoraja erinaceus TaxID=7782 RepID=UPI002458CF50|nr:phospholipid scramblase 2-like [Leucoraja erinacea]